ncbi:Biotin/lipoyl attachment [Cynara cardunculus var. scolymus]|uniref:Biotin/lipoyl attachment n=1 Tax=Cynara cardunculus var. scolymus TaxID=59895 RepID=A0A118K462_CYNCS|nr:Biotin/lipoyl attachment [Cynara cardunculus var. scolymus]
MESAAVLRSFHYSASTVSPLRSSFEKPGVVSMHNAAWRISTRSPIQGSAFGWDLVSSQKKQAGAIVSCLKSSEVAVVDKSNGSVEKSTSTGSTFPSGFEGLSPFMKLHSNTFSGRSNKEEARVSKEWRNSRGVLVCWRARSCSRADPPLELVLGVCDETQIAELKMKIGNFEMHLKRNIKSAAAIIPVASPTEAPPIPSKPMNESAPATPPSPPKPSSQKTNPFTNVPVEKSKKLAALEASGASGYVLVSCPTVGTFRKCRTLKGKKQPVLCKEGDIIKEGQTICYLDQFGTELPVKSDAAGEVIKILFDDGEAVGYGDPIIAVLPSFHDIK